MRPTPSRQQRRQQERDDERLLRQGLAPDSDGMAVLAMARRLVRALGQTSTDRASAAAAVVHAAYDGSAKRHPAGPVACRKGCSWCCASYVVATAPEIFLIARGLTGPRRLAAAAAVADAAAATRGQTVADRLAGFRLCPLLVDGACGVYATRPSACRSLLSDDSAACERSFAHHSGESLSGPAVGLILRSRYQAALRAALTVCSLTADGYELIAALDRVLTTPDAEARWLSGEDLFIGIPVETAAKPQFDASVRDLVAALRADGYGMA